MPIFEYECRECGDRFERLVLASSPASECPVCRSRDLEQLISSCAMSSETTRGANLSSAHKKVAAGRKERRHEEHKHLHQHFD